MKDIQAKTLEEAFQTAQTYGISQRQIAQQANVAQTTIERLSKERYGRGPAYVSHEVRMKVLAAVDALATQRVNQYQTYSAKFQQLQQAAGQIQ